MRCPTCNDRLKAFVQADYDVITGVSQPIAAFCPTCHKYQHLSNLPQDVREEIFARNAIATQQALDASTVLYWFHARPLGGAAQWSEIGKLYADALIKAVDITMVGLYGVLDDPSLAEYDAQLRAPLRKKFTTICCGFGGDFARPYCEGGRNIAITGCIPRIPNQAEIDLLKRWEVYALNGEHAENLVRAGLSEVKILQPTPAAFKELLG